MVGNFDIERSPNSQNIKCYVFLAKIRTTNNHNKMKIDDKKRTSFVNDDMVDETGGRRVTEDVEVRLNPLEHQDFKWVRTKEELEGLEMVPLLKPVMEDLMDALQRPYTRDKRE